MPALTEGFVEQKQSERGIRLVRCCTWNGRIPGWPGVTQFFRNITRAPAECGCRPLVWARKAAFGFHSGCRTYSESRDQQIGSPYFSFPFLVLFCYARKIGGTSDIFLLKKKNTNELKSSTLTRTTAVAKTKYRYTHNDGSRYKKKAKYCDV